MSRTLADIAQLYKSSRQEGDHQQLDEALARMIALISAVPSLHRHRVCYLMALLALSQTLRSAAQQHFLLRLAYLVHAVQRDREWLGLPLAPYAVLRALTGNRPADALLLVVRNIRRYRYYHAFRRNAVRKA